MKNQNLNDTLPFSKKFDEIMQITGKTYRDVQNRATVQFTHKGRNYFIKKHFGIGWKEIIKNLLKFKQPILGAYNEWLALKHLKKHKIAAPLPVTYGKKGKNPAKQQSFIITKTLKNKKSLNDLILEWQKHSPEFKLKAYLIKQLAKTVKAMHQSGLNHRDCYTVHFWIDENLHFSMPKDLPKMTIIDLHRAQIRKKVPQRYLIKDLAGLYFSVKEMMPLKKNDLLRFIKYYTAEPLKKVLKNEKNFWKKVRRKGEKLWEKHERKMIPYCEKQIKCKSVSQIISKKNRRFRLLVNKKYQDSFIKSFLENPKEIIEKGCILKDGRDSTISKITINNDTFIIKHYHPKTLKYKLKNLVCKSFAMRSWENSHRLLFHGLSVPEPVLVFEKLFGPLKKHSYFISKYIDGKNLSDILNTKIEGTTLSASHSLANTEEFEKKIQNLFERFRELKFSHGDLNSKNLLFKNGLFFLIDLDHCKWFRTRFFAKRWLEKDQMRFLRDFRKLPQLRKSLIKAINKKLIHKLARYDWHYEKKYLKKIFQKTAEITCKSNLIYRLIGYKKYTAFIDEFMNDPDKMIAKGDILKRGSATTVVKISHENQQFVIKRYKPKNCMRRLKNLFRMSLAAKSWKNAHRLLFHDLQTSAPVLILEKRVGLLNGISYYVSQYIDGITLTDILKNSADKQPSKHFSPLNSAKQLLQRFKELNFFHGDLKGTNLIIKNNQIFLIDLEHCKWFRYPFLAKRWLEKDRKRLFNVLGF